MLSPWPRQSVRYVCVTCSLCGLPASSHKFVWLQHKLVFPLAVMSCQGVQAACSLCVCRFLSNVSVVCLVTHLPITQTEIFVLSLLFVGEPRVQAKAVLSLVLIHYWELPAQQLIYSFCSCTRERKPHRCQRVQKSTKGICQRKVSDLRRSIFRMLTCRICR